MANLIPNPSGMNIDVGYQKLFEMNLFHQTWLTPEVTFTDKYQMNGVGQIMVRKLKNATGTVPGKPGRDFTDKYIEDDLIPINLCNNFQESDKAPAVALASMNADAKAKMIENVSLKVRDGMGQSALACLVQEAKSGTGTTVTASNAKTAIVTARKEIVKAKGFADTVLCTPDTYAAILEAAGDKFEPTRNDRIALDGQVGRWLGFNFIECNGLAETNAVYRPDYDTDTTVEFAGLQFIMYDHRAFSVCTNLSMIRLMDSDPRFYGTLAQIEANVGFKVTNQDLVYKFTAA